MGHKTIITGGSFLGISLFFTCTFVAPDDLLLEKLSIGQHLASKHNSIFAMWVGKTTFVPLTPNFEDSKNQAENFDLFPEDGELPLSSFNDEYITSGQSDVGFELHEVNAENIEDNNSLDHDNSENEPTTVGLNVLSSKHPWPTPLPLIEWTADPRASKYLLQIDDSEECSSPLSEVVLESEKAGTAPKTHYKYPEYLENGNYFICIKSFDISGKILGSSLNTLEVRAEGHGHAKTFNGHSLNSGKSPLFERRISNINSVFVPSLAKSKKPTGKILGFGRNFAVFSDPNEEHVIKLFLVDSLWNRVLIFNKFPDASGQEPDLALGQKRFDKTLDEEVISATTLNRPSHVSVCQDGRLLVTDQGNNRILIWKKIPHTSNVPADFVIGQEDFTTHKSGLGPSNLDSPVAAFCTPKGIFVSDSGNHRILIFESEKSKKASWVLGQKSMYTRKKSCNQYSVSSVEDLWLKDNQLILADTGNHRILFFDQLNLNSTNRAHHVIGQKDFDTCKPNRGLKPSEISSDTLHEPSTIFFTEKNMLVSDRRNQRILVFPKVDQYVAKEAVDVIGASNFGPHHGDRLYFAPLEPSDSMPMIASETQPVQGLFLSGQGLWTLTQKTHQLIRIAIPKDL